MHAVWMGIVNVIPGIPTLKWLTESCHTLLKLGLLGMEAMAPEKLSFARKRWFGSSDAYIVTAHGYKGSLATHNLLTSLVKTCQIMLDKIIICDPSHQNLPVVASYMFLIYKCIFWCKIWNCYCLHLDKHIPSNWTTQTNHLIVCVWSKAGNINNSRFYIKRMNCETRNM